MKWGLKMLEKIKSFCTKNRYSILFMLLFMIGILIRTIGIASYPNALNVDEASAGYDAYSILTTGSDRNGNFLPVYFVAWGSRTKCTFELFDDSLYSNFWIIYFIY